MMICAGGSVQKGLSSGRYQPAQAAHGALCVPVWHQDDRRGVRSPDDRNAEETRIQGHPAANIFKVPVRGRAYSPLKRPLVSACALCRAIRICCAEPFAVLSLFLPRRTCRTGAFRWSSTSWKQRISQIPQEASRCRASSTHVQNAAQRLSAQSRWEQPVLRLLPSLIASAALLALTSCVSLWFSGHGDFRAHANEATRGSLSRL